MNTSVPLTGGSQKNKAISLVSYPFLFYFLVGLSLGGEGERREERNED
jgi:hypothetical protein